eukprot:TRINITY_DN98543_c0_g1_i1.p1 TRINITY_DN98543_c0_g1~~TRINITY_DN98543_c0_g1_i1.p1  ORF type:complete len:504 (+),score=106.52 TRINITY_DN98543_c0_g1_i1:14-1525(+)
MDADADLVEQIPLYVQPPQVCMERERIQEIASRRLQLLLLVAKGCEEPLEAVNSTEDAVGHFTLCLLCCSDGAWSSWFIMAELKLLSLRWEAATHDVRLAALAECGQKPCEDERYCIDFRDLPPVLLAERRAVLQKGKAYLPVTDSSLLLEWLRCLFKDHLCRALNRARSETVQFKPLLQVISALKPEMEAILKKWQVDPNVRAENGGGGVGLNLDNFDECVHQSFPPCMQHLVWSLQFGARLKNLGRLQLRSFLREAGLSLSGALHWWRRELMRDPSMSHETWQNEHLYQVEHAYGLRGSCKMAFAKGCKKTLQMPTPTLGQVHGCPFRVLGEQQLLQLLGRTGLSKEAAAEALAKESAEQRCAEVFRARHPSAPSELIGPPGHPNEFLRRSRQAIAIAYASSSAEEPQICIDSPAPSHAPSQAQAQDRSLQQSAEQNPWKQCPEPLPHQHQRQQAPPQINSSLPPRGEREASRTPRLQQPLRVATGLNALFAKKWPHLLGA